MAADNSSDREDPTADSKDVRSWWSERWETGLQADGMTSRQVHATLYCTDRHRQKDSMFQAHGGTQTEEPTKGLVTRAGLNTYEDKYLKRNPFHVNLQRNIEFSDSEGILYFPAYYPPFLAHCPHCGRSPGEIWALLRGQRRQDGGGGRRLGGNLAWV